MIFTKSSKKLILWIRHLKGITKKFMENLDSIQLLNTAIVKSKEKSIDSSYEERLKKICSKPVVESINKAILYLSESEKISRDQAATIIIETFKDLDKIWTDYVMMEGIGKLKDTLKSNH